MSLKSYNKLLTSPKWAQDWKPKPINPR